MPVKPRWRDDRQLRSASRHGAAPRSGASTAVRYRGGRAAQGRGIRDGRGAGSLGFGSRLGFFGRTGHHLLFAAVDIHPHLLRRRAASLHRLGLRPEMPRDNGLCGFLQDRASGGDRVLARFPQSVGGFSSRDLPHFRQRFDDFTEPARRNGIRIAAALRPSTA